MPPCAREGRGGRVVIPLVGGLVWLVHAGRTVVGRRSVPALVLWLVGMPVLCLVDYVVYAVWVPPSAETGMAGIRPVDEALLGNLFLGLAAWLALLALEPVLLLVAALRRARRGA